MVSVPQNNGASSSFESCHFVSALCNHAGKKSLKEEMERPQVDHNATGQQDHYLQCRKHKNCVGEKSGEVNSPQSNDKNFSFMTI